MGRSGHKPIDPTISIDRQGHTQMVKQLRLETQYTKMLAEPFLRIDASQKQVHDQFHLMDFRNIYSKISSPLWAGPIFY